jgi:hypothetical protein
MTSLINFLRKIPSFRECLSSYRPLPKKDDDSGIQRAEAWMKANPIEKSTLNRYHMSRQQIDAYGRKIIQGLKFIHVDSSNEGIIKTYLTQVCEINTHVRRYLFEHLTEIQADKSIVKGLQEIVSTTYPP